MRIVEKDHCRSVDAELLTIKPLLHQNTLHKLLGETQRVANIIKTKWKCVTNLRNKIYICLEYIFVGMSSCHIFLLPRSDSSILVQAPLAKLLREIVSHFCIWQVTIFMQRLYYIDPVLIWRRKLRSLHLIKWTEITLTNSRFFRSAYSEMINKICSKLEE